jgi:hypothetical protein
MKVSNICRLMQMTAWRSVSSHGINGPPFFRNASGHTVTVNTVWYKVMLETFLQNGLHPCQVDLVCFQQDGATAHMTQMQCKFSVQRFQADSFLVLRDITCLTHLPDHTVLDYFLLGNDKTKVQEMDLQGNATMLRQPFHGDCRSVLNDMAVTYKVSYSNSNDSGEFS